MNAAVDETVRASGMTESGVLREDAGTYWARGQRGGKPGEPVSEKRTGLGSVGGERTMNETTPSTTETNGRAKRVRRQYDAAFKQSAVAHCQRHGGDVKRTAQELGLNHWTLRDWLQAQRDKNQPTPAALTLAETQAEIGRLRTDLARVTEQREILKKSLGILSLP